MCLGRWRSSPACLEWRHKHNQNGEPSAHRVPPRVFATQPLQLLTEELRKRNRLQYGRENIEVTQKQLATFRRENTDAETILRQQRHDRETRAALVVLESGKRPPTQLFPVEEEKRELEQGVPEKEKKANPY